MSIINKFIFVANSIGLILIHSILYSAPPFPGIRGKTYIESKSETIRISPEAYIEIKSSTPKEGEVKCIVFLAEFQDKNFNIKIDGNNYPAKEYFRELMFGKSGENSFYPFGSFREFWEINSYYKLRITGEVFGPYKLDYKLSDYGCGSRNTGSSYCGFGGGAQAILNDLLQKSSADIDFSKFDSNQDGKIDCVIIIHAGEGAEVQQDSSPNNSQCCDIWSHAFSTYRYIQGYYIESAVIAAGISELFPYGNMGLIAHEFGHLLGLPDLYDTLPAGVQSCGVGPYSLMGYGLYRGIQKDGKLIYGVSPSNLSPWEKIYLGWASPNTITNFVCDTMLPSSSTSVFLKLPAYANESSPEYFLVEFRKRENFDLNFPSEGILIWHIDEDVINSAIAQNRINVYECYPGCGNTCGEIKDRQGQFIGCTKHYGVRVILGPKSRRWRFETTSVQSNSAACLESDPNDFWKDDRFPDSYTSSFGYRGEEHTAYAIFLFDKEQGTVRIGAAVGSTINKAFSAPEYFKNYSYDWSEPGGLYSAKIGIRGTPPIHIRIISPPEAYIDGLRELILHGYESTIEREIYVIWQAPNSERIARFRLSAENCIGKLEEEWEVRVQKSKTSVNTSIQDADGTSSPMGCSCKSYSPSGSTSFINLFTASLIIVGTTRILRKLKRKDANLTKTDF